MFILKSFTKDFFISGLDFIFGAFRLIDFSFRKCFRFLSDVDHQTRFDRVTSFVEAVAMHPVTLSRLL